MLIKHISDKIRVSTIYFKNIKTYVSKLNQKTNNPIQEKNFQQTFAKENIWLANMDMKRCSSALVIREMQI